MGEWSIGFFETTNNKAVIQKNRRFSGGMDEISPASPIERLFAVAVGTFIFVIALVPWWDNRPTRFSQKIQHWRCWGGKNLAHLKVIALFPKRSFELSGILHVPH